MTGQIIDSVYKATATTTTTTVATGVAGTKSSSSKGSARKKNTSRSHSPRRPIAGKNQNQDASSVRKRRGKSRGRSSSKQRDINKSPSGSSSRRRRRSSSAARSSPQATGGTSRPQTPKKKRQQGKKNEDDNDSVGSALSLSDQFDIILPIKPGVLNSADREGRHGMPYDDDVSSITTDEYRKYGGLLWRLTHNMSGGMVSPSGTGGGGGRSAAAICCGPICPCVNDGTTVAPGIEPSASRTIQSGTMANTRTTVGRSGAFHRSSPTPAPNNKDQAKVSTKDGDGGGDAGPYNFCCFSSGQVSKVGVMKSNSNQKNDNSRNLSSSFSKNQSKRDHSVDRTASLFDETLSEGESPNPGLDRPSTDDASRSDGVAGLESIELEHDYRASGGKGKNNKKWRLPWTRNNTRRDKEIHPTVVSSNNTSGGMVVLNNNKSILYDQQAVDVPLSKATQERGRTMVQSETSEDVRRGRGRGRSAGRKSRSKSRGRSATPQRKIKKYAQRPVPHNHIL